jgi:hypothetical protein
MRSRRSVPLAMVLALLLLAAPGVASAAIVEVSPGEDLEAAIAALDPGDELIVHGGEYPQTERFSIDLMGTPEMPILIRAADGERPIVSRGDESQNLIDLVRVEHVVIRGIEFRGGSAGLRISRAIGFTLEECEIHETGDVALRMNDGGGVYQDLRILRNHIHDTHGTGEGMYLGCHDGSCQVVDSLIEGNYVHHTNAADIEQGDGIEIKQGSYGNIVRDNVIHDTNYPCILTYNNGGAAPNVLERNVMWNCGDMGIQSEADTTIRNNIILSAGANGIGCQPHVGGSPSNLTIVNNTILDSDGTAIRISGASGLIVVANNALYTDGASALDIAGDLSMVTVAGNVVLGSASPAGGTTGGSLAADFVSAMFTGAPPNDVFPRAGGALVGTGDDRFTPTDDFNGTTRTTDDVGAYAFDADGNPGWVIVPGFRDAVGTPPGSDGGVPTGDGGSTTTTDGGPGGPDGSTGPRPDGSTVPGRDAGAGAMESGGCSCRAAGRGGAGAAGSIVAALAVALASIARRRRDARAR